MQYKNEKQYTYADYLSWPKDEHWELIHGVAYNMSPAPNTAHQTVSVELASQIAIFLRGKPCQVFAAPFDIRLPKSDESDNIINTVVQPDIAVICDPGKIDAKGCRGAPDQSPQEVQSTRRQRDRMVRSDDQERSRRFHL